MKYLSVGHELAEGTDGVDVPPSAPCYHDDRLPSPATVPGTCMAWTRPDDRLPYHAACYDCGRPYAEFNGDVSLPDEIWERINPTRHDGAGLLCANCIMRRLRAVGLTGVTAKLWA